MAKNDKTLKYIGFGPGSVVSISGIDHVSAFDNGVGLLNASNDMIGWIDTYTVEQSAQVVEIMLELMNNPVGAQQPDWRFIVDPEEVGTSALTVVSARHAEMPARSTNSTAKASGAASTL